MLTCLFSFLAMRDTHSPDISQPLNNKKRHTRRLSHLFLLFCQLNGPVMSFCSHGMTGPQRGGRTWLSLACHRALLSKLSLGATLHSPRQLLPVLMPDLPLAIFLIQGWNKRAQIIVIVFSGYCHNDYVRYGTAMVPSRSVSSPHPTCEPLWNVFSVARSEMASTTEPIGLIIITRKRARRVTVCLFAPQLVLILVLLGIPKYDCVALVNRLCSLHRRNESSSQSSRSVKRCSYLFSISLNTIHPTQICFMQSKDFISTHLNKSLVSKAQ